MRVSLTSVGECVDRSGWIWLFKTPPRKRTDIVVIIAGWRISKVPGLDSGLLQPLELDFNLLEAPGLDSNVLEPMSWKKTYFSRKKLKWE